MSEILVKNPPNALTVSHVEPGSAAARAGIRAGDLLREMNGKPMLDILDYQFNSDGDILACTIERDGGVKRVTDSHAAPDSEPNCTRSCWRCA